MVAPLIAAAGRTLAKKGARKASGAVKTTQKPHNVQTVARQRSNGGVAANDNYLSKPPANDNRLLEKRVEREVANKREKRKRQKQGNDTEETSVKSIRQKYRLGKKSRELIESEVQKAFKRAKAIRILMLVSSWLFMGYIWQLVMASLSIMGLMIEMSTFVSFFTDGIFLIVLSWILLSVYNAVFIVLASLQYIKAGIKPFNGSMKQFLLIFSFIGFSLPIINLIPWMLPWMLYVTKNPE